MAAAASSVLQHRSARKAPERHAAGFRLLAHLAGNPVWLLGVLFAAVGLALHAVALAGGRLAVVQPLLVCGLLFALPVSVALEGRRLSPAEGGWALALVAGLAAFLLVARPSGGVVSVDADVLAWITGVGVAAMAVVGYSGMRWRRLRAPLVAVAAGLGYGITAALLKQTAAVASHGISNIFADWPVYVLIAVGGTAIGLTQVAYRAGPLAESLPVLTVTDPASSILIGALAFHEKLSSSALAVAVELAAFVVMGIASAKLAR
jgi:drug/metabolite transporter (DMT)-like permease